MIIMVTFWLEYFYSFSDKVIIGKSVLMNQLQVNISYQLVTYVYA